MSKVREELFLVHFPQHPVLLKFLPVALIEQDRRRAEQTQFVQQCLLCRRVFGHVQLQKGIGRERVAHFSSTEHISFHHLAGDAPVGVEVEHHGLSLLTGRAKHLPNCFRIRHPGEFGMAFPAGCADCRGGVREWRQWFQWILGAGNRTGQECQAVGK
ncbi:MAG: hypothetical protein AWU57_3658 [Marinobacter sp. T13-3]|nr:MAG: hypothetical protein AWU57_3658 [Marinobacter sp. T13-3]